MGPFHELAEKKETKDVINSFTNILARDLKEYCLECATLPKAYMELFFNHTIESINELKSTLDKYNAKEITETELKEIIIEQKFTYILFSETVP